MMPIEPDHYGILELEPGSPMEDVKSHYRRLAKRYHPDLHGNDAQSQAKFRRINAAYTFLSDAPRKAAYDEILKAARKMGVPPLKAVPPPSKAVPKSPTATGHHMSVSATGLHEKPLSDVRMTRSAWLGATAGLVLVLLVIGLSLDNSGPGHSVGVEATAPAPAGSLSGSALENGSKTENGLEPGVGMADAPPSPPLPTYIPFAHSAAAAALPTPPHIVSGPPALFPASITSTPRDENRVRRARRDLSTAYLAGVSAPRLSVQPATAPTFQQKMHKRSSRTSPLIVRYPWRLASVQIPVHDEIKALSKVSTAFHFAPHTQARKTLLVSSDPAPVIPFKPASRMAPAAPEASSLPNTPVSNPKVPASTGQEFIWMNKSNK